MVFSLPALWWRRIGGLWELPDGIDWLRGKLGLVLVGRAMHYKSLIQFSVDGCSCVPSLLFTWGQTMVEVMKIMATSSWVLVHTRFCLCPSRVCFPRVFQECCVSSVSSLVGLMVTSSKRAYAIPRSTAPRDLAPAAVHCWPVPPKEIPKHNSFPVSVGFFC